MVDDLDLDALLAEAAATRLEPSAALTARILGDAAAVQPPLPRAPAGRPRYGFWRWASDLVAGLGGGPALAGLSLAGVTGLVLGVADPTALQSITTLIGGETTLVAQMDLLPATDILWTEN
ncbi:MAG: hypothetical protein WCO04_15335 [Pseudomonadota bacterium]